MSQSSEAVTRDPRLDRVITWILTTLLGIALLIGSSHVKTLNTTIEGLRKEVGQLTTKIAVQIAVSEAQQSEVRRLEVSQRRAEKRLLSIERRMGEGGGG